MTFLSTVGRLKFAPRQGWLDRGVAPARTESVAGHMYRMGVLCSLCPDPSLNRSRLVQIALAHDMAEAIVGDVSPAMKVSKEVKRAAEARAMEAQLGPLLVEAAQREEIVGAWREYEDHITAESMFVHDVDALEMVLQAYEYETELGQFLPQPVQPSADAEVSASPPPATPTPPAVATAAVDLSGFFTSVGKIRHPWLRAIGDRVLERRAARLAAESIPPALLGVASSASA
jgi:putative hydrolase of HD superfamily